MGYSPDWQKQSYAKGGSTPKVTQKGNIVSRELFHNAQSRVGLADGGDPAEEALKQEGMAAANADYNARMEGKSGFERFKEGAAATWERIKAGNIDAPGSEAYEKYGAGRGRAERSKRAEADGAANRGDNSSEWDSGRKPMGMGDAASVERVSAPKESNPTDATVGDYQGQKSKMYTAEPASGVEVKPYKPEPTPKPKKLSDDTADTVRPRSVARKTPSVAKDMKPASQEFPIKKELQGETSQSFPLTAPRTAAEVRSGAPAKPRGRTSAEIRTGANSEPADKYLRDIGDSVKSGVRNAYDNFQNYRAENKRKMEEDAKKKSR